MKHDTQHTMAKKFKEDKAIDRVATLMSGALMLINVGMTMEAESEVLLQRYGVLIKEIKYRAEMLGKAYDRYMDVVGQLYSKEGNTDFAAEYDKMLHDMYVYLGIPEKWEPGQDGTHDLLGFHHAFQYCLKRRGRKATRFVGRTPSGQLWISAKPDGKAYPLPKSWFPGIKKSEIRKVAIDPEIKF